MSDPDFLERTLAHVADIVMGQSPPGSSYNENGVGVPFLQGKAEFGDEVPRHVKWTSDPRKVAPVGSVLVSVRAPVGASNLAEHRYAIGRGLAALVPGEEVDARYLFYWMRHKESALDALGSGSTFNSVNRSTLTSFPIAFPPIPKQRAIAQVLGTVHRAKEQTEQVIAAARQLKRSVVPHLFRHGAVAPDPVQESDSTESEIGEFPSHWKVREVGRVTSAIQYGLSKRGRASGDFPILRMNNLIDGQVRPLELQFVDLEEEEVSRFRLNRGDVLFNRTNSHEKVGKVGLFDLEGDYVFASYLLRLSPNSACILPEYLNEYLHSETAQRGLKRLAARAVSQSNINASKVRKFQLPVPPLTEQREITLMVSALNDKIVAEEQRRDALDQLFKTLLHELMTGRIRFTDRRDVA